MRIESISAGMKAVALYDNGLKTGGLAVYEVLKVGRVKVKVRNEQGQEGWLYPAALDREISEARYVELMDEMRPAWRGAASGPATA